MRRASALALTFLLILVSLTTVQMRSVNAQANNGSFMQSFWTGWTNPAKKVVIFHISHADMARSGTQRFLTITDLLEAADAASDAEPTLLGLLSQAEWAVSVAVTPNSGDGGFDFTIVQINGNWVFAYFGICNMPLTPSCQLAPFPWSLFYLGQFSSLPTPGYWLLYFH